MAGKPYLILFASQKGGVGKTTVSLNLACALVMRKYKVLLVDTDIESASMSEQLGVKADSKGYLDVLGGKVEIDEVLFAYEPVDLYLIPGTPAEERLMQKPEIIEKFYSKLSHADFDFIIIDSPPGLFPSEISRYFNDVAILTTPDSVASSGSAKMAKYCDKHKISHKLIINRMGYSKFDLEKDEVEKIYGDVAFIAIPEDKIIAESVRKHKPAYVIDRSSDFSVAVEELARDYALKVGESDEDRKMEFERDTKPSFFGKFFGWVSK